MSTLKPRTFLNSKFQNSKQEIEKHVFFWFHECGVNQTHIINAVMTKSKMILKLVDECIEVENRIKEEGFENISKLIILWTLLGSILETVIKVHCVIFRKDFLNIKKSKDKKNIWAIKTSLLINELLNLGHISEYEKVFLQKLNGTRNCIHLLSDNTIYNYDHYLNYVESLINLTYNLVKRQKAFRSYIGDNYYNYLDTRKQWD